jgi:glyoxylase-like metal-dependent hydrolase (beta-lactamase superfamily II)
MAHLKIIVNGYAKKRLGYELATPNTVLIFDGTSKILVDPGSNKRLLLNGLKKERLKPKDINIVLITHYHLDHILNLRLFPEHDIYDGNTINRGDKIIGYSGKVPRTNIKVIPTPGHSFEHCSYLVQTAQGNVAVAGDVWWWNEREKPKTDRKSLLAKKDPFVKSKSELLQSRKKLLAVAGFIIPGHGKMFKVEK